MASDNLTPQQKARRELARRELARRASIAPEGYAYIAEDSKGGKVFERPDGQFEYVSEGASRIMPTLPDNIEDISGQIRGDLLRDYDEAELAAHPVASKSVSFLSGFPFVGESVDNAIGVAAPGLAQAWQRGQHAMERQRPKTDMALKVAGALVPSAAAALSIPVNAMRGSGGFLGNMLKGGAIGAGLGATDAALQTIGDNDTGPRMEGVMDAVFGGGTLGGVVGAAASPLGFGASALASALSRPGRAARSARRELGVNKPGAEMIADAVDADAPNVQANLDRAGRYAINAMSGPNTANLLDAAVNRPLTAARHALYRVKAQTSQAGEHMTKLLDDNFGPPAGLQRTKDEIMDSTWEARQRAYDAAYRKPINYADPKAYELENILDQVPADILNDANRLMKVRGERGLQIKFTINDNGDVVFSQPPGVREIDYMTRALRNKGDWGVGEGKEMGRAYMSLAKQLRTQVDELVPEYRAARAAGADAMAMRDAADLGAISFKKNLTRAELEDAIEGMTDVELKALRSGVRYQADEMMANINTALLDPDQPAREAVAALKKMFLNRAGRDKLKLILGNDADDVVRQMEEISSVFELRAKLHPNSATFRRTQQEDILDEAVPLTFGENLAEGTGVLGALTSKARPLITAGGPTRTQRQAKLMGSVADALMQPPRRPVGILEQLQNDMLMSRAAGQTARDAVSSGVVPTIFGLQPVNPFNP